MSATPADVETYVCPMHPDVWRAEAGTCPKCGMPLVVKGTHFALLRHMTGKPAHLVVMTLLMLAVMAAVMLLLP